MGVEINPLDHIKGLIRPIIHAYNTWRMNNYLDREFGKRYRSVLGNTLNPGKSVIDLALKAYLSENPAATGVPAPFRSAAMAQIKLFLFAGHDTTSTAVVFTFHLLSKHPKVLHKVREEHEAVFGTNVSELPTLLKSKPHLLNQLPYTLAVVKEALRLYPTVSALRKGQSDFFLVDHNANGQCFPTEGCMIWGDHYANHHNPHIWVRPEDYLPERWLCNETDEFYPPKNAWRPFERGPRNCIGQVLALTEIKLILVLTTREFDINDAYAEFDMVKGNTRNMKVNGNRAYMVRIGGGGHPADGYPCKVRELDGR
jgi:cytochrome P450